MGSYSLTNITAENFVDYDFLYHKVSYSYV